MLSLPARTSERLWEHSCCPSSACIVVGAVTVTPAENFVSPLSESSPPRNHLKKKKSVSPHDSLAVHPGSKRTFANPSKFLWTLRSTDWNEQQSTVGEVSQRLKVMALARRPAGPDNAVPSLPGSDSWLSEKKQTKINKSEACFCTSWCSQATSVGTFWMLGSSRAFDFVWLCHLCDLLTISVRDKPATWLLTVM